MPKALNALKVASAAAFTVAFIPLAALTSTSSAATSCDDVKFVFARGSGQKLNDREYQAFKHELKTELSRGGSNLRYSFYELGAASYSGASYQAVDITPLNMIGAKISAGSASSYGVSVNEGITELKAYIREISSSCKSTRFVLAGYSQGAQVITMAAEELNAHKIIYAATYGDPKLYLPEGKGVYPDACRGKNLSPYREFAPNCRTSAGSLGAKNPYQISSWKDKKGLWCNNKDIICGAGLSLTGGKGDTLISRLANSMLAGHTSYVDDGIIASSAKTITEKLRTIYPSKIGKSNALAYNRDTIILIDRTNSMSGLISRYKTEALSLANRTISGGGRVALYTYGDLKEGEETQRLTNLGDTLIDFQTGLNSIQVRGGGDEPESMLSAIYTAMSEQKWRAGATKSIVVLTDAPYHNPDHDGTDIAKVVAKSYEIDPVNIYIIDEYDDLRSTLELVTTPTGGQVFSSTDSISTDLLTSRPNVSLPLAEYIGRPGEEFTFTASASDDVVSYSWDLDFDGAFETTTSVPTITKSFPTLGQGYITVKATDSAGNSSTASAKIIITNNLSSPEITELKIVNQTESKNTATISYQFKSSAVATLVSINDAPLGLTDQTTLEITGLTGPTAVTLVPISNTGAIGEPVSITIGPESEVGYGSDSDSSKNTEQTEQPKQTGQTDQSNILVPNSGKK